MTLKEALEEHNRQTELAYFKRKLADVLLWQVIQKAVKANVGEVREWSNGKHKKLANGKWIPVRENEKINQMAIELKRKIDLAKNEEDLMKIVAGSKQYFTDGLGFFFPIVKELDKYIDRKHAKLGKQNERKEDTLLPLEENIDTILHGTPQEKAKLQRSFFKVADTSQELKKLGLKGDYFTVKYGTISHHKSKDLDHALTAKNWIDICKKINKPFLVAKDLDGNYRLFVDTKVNGKFVMIGVEIKHSGENLFINAIKTALGRNNNNNAKILYVDKNITVEQLALLERSHAPQYPGIQKALKLPARLSDNRYILIR